MSLLHPREALYQGEKALPALPVCEHFAGNEKVILKAFELQETLGRAFDVTCDCEDGAKAGHEKEHAEMIARLIAARSTAQQSSHRVGVRIHDPAHPACRLDIEIVVAAAAASLAYVTVPKVGSVSQVKQVMEDVERVAARHAPGRRVALHVLVETHGALKDAAAIAALPGVETLDFGLMDFVAAHHGAIPASAVRSPGQFEHRLVARAKTELVAAALAHGVVPSHNVTLDIKDPRAAFNDARRARDEFGFRRMYSIHPVQIAPIIDAMKPEHAEVEQAAGILLAAQAAAWGPIRYEGEMHDRATYRLYWDLLQKARITGVAIPAPAAKAFFEAP